MALCAGRLLQEQNLNIHYNVVGGQKNDSKAPKKGGVTAGRKPLGDFQSRHKKQNTNDFSIADKEATTTTSKIPFGTNKKKSIPNASVRVQTGARKALSDSSNLIRPCARQTAAKNRNAKQNIVIEEECFLHDHQESIKAQKRSMHMNEFLQMVGPDKDFSRESSLSRTPPMSNQTKPNSCLKNSELVEMAELLNEDQSVKRNLSSKLVSPSATRTPEPANHFEQ